MKHWIWESLEPSYRDVHPPKNATASKKKNTYCSPSGVWISLLFMGYYPLPVILVPSC